MIFAVGHSEVLQNILSKPLIRQYHRYLLPTVNNGSLVVLNGNIRHCNDKIVIMAQIECLIRASVQLAVYNCWKRSFRLARARQMKFTEMFQ